MKNNSDKKANYSETHRNPLGTELLTPADVAAHYKITNAIQRRLRQEGLLEYIKPGHRTIRYRPAQIEACLAKLTVK